MSMFISSELTTSVSVLWKTFYFIMEDNLVSVTRNLERFSFYCHEHGIGLLLFNLKSVYYDIRICYKAETVFNDVKNLRFLRSFLPRVRTKNLFFKYHVKGLF